MMRSESWSWSWPGADDMRAHAHHVHHEFRASQAAGFDSWELLVDIYETDTDVVVYAALPGVDPSTVSTRLDAGAVTISGRHAIPQDLRGASIHRLELPQGRFERRVVLPPGRYEEVSRSSSHGCVILTVRKAAGA